MNSLTDSRVLLSVLLGLIAAFLLAVAFAGSGVGLPELALFVVLLVLAGKTAIAVGRRGRNRG
ncbi:MAG: hypothetical protein HOQ45_02940 [Nocardioidaceae bacterium]|nr:hypothetical protein [Nocardioidaceae bacterium]